MTDMLATQFRLTSEIVQGCHEWVVVIASEPIAGDRLRAALGGATDDAEIMVVGRRFTGSSSTHSARTSYFKIESESRRLEPLHRSARRAYARLRNSCPVADAAVADVDELPPQCVPKSMQQAKVYVFTHAQPVRATCLAGLPAHKSRHAADERLDPSSATCVRSASKPAGTLAMTTP
jgi:hypothetical protein